MEAFGRLITVCLAAVSVFLVIFCGRRAIVFRQRERTVQSLTRECAKEIMDTQLYSVQKIKALERQLECLGDFTVECIVLERVFYETEEGKTAQYRICESEMTGLSAGSFLRICVTENRTKSETFFYGVGVIMLAGGRIL